VHQILTRTTYIGQHRFNARDHKTRTAKPEAEHAVLWILI
jgi:site-specific DNA recombinase